MCMSQQTNPSGAWVVRNIYQPMAAQTGAAVLPDAQKAQVRQAARGIALPDRPDGTSGARPQGAQRRPSSSGTDNQGQGPLNIPQ